MKAKRRTGDGRGRRELGVVDGVEGRRVSWWEIVKKIVLCGWQVKRLEKERKVQRQAARRQSRGRREKDSARAREGKR